MQDRRYTFDNERNPINVFDFPCVLDNTQFIPSKFDNVPLSSVEIIKNDLINNERFGERNKKRLENLIIKT